MIHISIFIFIHSSIQSLFYYHDGCSVYFHEMKIPMNSIIWRFYFLGEFCLAFGDGGAGGGQCEEKKGSEYGHNQFSMVNTSLFVPATTTTTTKKKILFSNEVYVQFISL